MAAETPHFKFPFTRGSYVEQDSSEHVFSCVNVIARFPQGFRPDRPNFGIPWPVFGNVPVDPATIKEAIEDLEPRAALSIHEYGEIADSAVRHLETEVRG